MILARVLEGKQCLGNPTMVEPPIIIGYEETMLRYDTTRDMYSSIVVTYRDQQAYPAYLISFKPKGFRPASSLGAGTSRGTGQALTHFQQIQQAAQHAIAAALKPAPSTAPHKPAASQALPGGYRVGDRSGSVSFVCVCVCLRVFVCVCLYIYIYVYIYIYDTYT